MIELGILKLFCLDRQNYTRYSKALNRSYLRSNYKTLHRLFSLLETAYQSENHPEKLSREDLEALYLRSYPVLKDQERKELAELLDRVFATDVTVELLESCLDTHRERALAGELAVKSLEVAEGRGSFASLQSLWDEYKGVRAKVEVEYVTDDLNNLYEAVASESGIRWPWDCLNRSLGPLRKGNFGFVFARPEVGKTTFLAHFITHAVQIIKKPIIWINNEQPGAEVMIRLYQAMFGITVQELFKNKTRFMKKYRELTHGLIKLRDDATISRNDIEVICEQEQPALVVFDQIDKIYGFDSDKRDDLVLGSKYQWARELAKSYCPVIGITQADVSGENVKYLTMENVANAKTSKQAEADWILGIGATANDDFSHYRYFNISKNKLLGDDHTVPGERHGRYQVRIDPEIAHYSEV